MLIFTLLAAIALNEQPVELPAYSAIQYGARYATEAEYDRARTDGRFKLTRVSYESDGLTVYAYVYGPKTAPREPLPVVVFNRGSYIWKEFAGEYVTMFHRFADAGFVVIAPMYRGSGG